MEPQNTVSIGMALNSAGTGDAVSVSVPGTTGNIKFEGGHFHVMIGEDWYKVMPQGMQGAQGDPGDTIYVDATMPEQPKRKRRPRHWALPDRPDREL